MKIFYTILILLFSPSLLFANTSGAVFLKISPGAKPVGMGGAYTALSGDINCLYYNPAGISNITDYQIGATHTKWIKDLRYDFAAGIFNINKGVLGVSATLLYMGELEGRGINREKTNDFGAYDFALQLSYAKNCFGTSLKFIRQKIEKEDTSGVAVDLGFLKNISQNLKLGLAVKNIGTEMEFISKEYNLPLIFSSGLGLTIGGVNIALDANYEVIDNNIKFSFGTEYIPVQFLSIRGGYLLSLINNNHEKLLNNFNGLSGGIGFNISSYSLDYAVVPYSDLGTTQRISFTTKF